MRYFNKETGLEGKTYEQKTSMRVCDELRQKVHMNAFIEEKGETFLCNVVSKRGCDSDERELIKELKENSFEQNKEQLGDMDEEGETMTVDLKKKKYFLQQILERSERKDEF